jgi:hypothetical protein
VRPFAIASMKQVLKKLKVFLKKPQNTLRKIKVIVVKRN